MRNVPFMFIVAPAPSVTVRPVTASVVPDGTVIAPNSRIGPLPPPPPTTCVPPLLNWMPPEPGTTVSESLPVPETLPVIVIVAVPVALWRQLDPLTSVRFCNDTLPPPVLVYAALPSSVRLANVRPLTDSPSDVFISTVLPDWKVVTLSGAFAPNGFDPAVWT